MPRAHRLPPIAVSHEQVFHAYTSPPLPEKGAPPTIIVTPAEPVSAQDFQVHFFSPTPFRSTFFHTSSRLSKFLSRLKPAPKLGQGPIGLGISTPQLEDKRPIVAYNGYELYSPVPTSEYGVIRLPEDEDEFDNEEMVVIKRKTRRWSPTKKIRMVLFLMLPMLLVLFHLVSARMGFDLGFDFEAVETEAHHDHGDIFGANLWEWSSTHTVAMDDLRVADALTGEGVVPEMELATMTLDLKNTPTPAGPIVDYSL